MSTHPFRAAIEAADHEAAFALLADDVTFRSPVVHRPYHGKASVVALLRHVVEVFSDFRYVDELAGERTTALVFRAKVGDRELEGIDYLTTDADGRITELAVMIRPLTGLLPLAEAMRARIEADPLSG